MSAAAVHLGPTGHSSDHGDLDAASRADDAKSHSIYLFLAGRAGGQDAIGGTGASDELTLQGSSNATLGIVRLKSKLQLEPVQSQAVPVDTLGSMIEFAETFSTSAPVTTSLIRNNSTWNANAGTGGIGQPAGRTLDDSSTVNINDNPGAFALFAAINSNPTFIITNNAHRIPNQFALRWQPILRGATGGLPTATGAVTGLEMTPYLQASGILSKFQVANMSAVTLRPSWSSPEFSEIHFGDLVGFDFIGPILGVAGGNLGIKTVDDAVGIRMGAPTAGLTVNGSWTAVLSQMGADAKHFMLRNEGGAKSTFGIGDLFFGTFDAEELEQTWDPGTNVFALQPTGAGGDFGIQINAEKLSLGTVLPDPSVTSLGFLTVASPNQTAVGAGDFTFYDFRTATVSPNGFALGNISLFNMGVPNVGIGTFENVTNLTLSSVPQESATDGNQSLWLAAGARSRNSGIENLATFIADQLTADENNFELSPGGLGHLIRRPVYFVTSDASRRINGINDAFPKTQHDDLVVFYNDGAFDVVFGHEDVAANAGRRINSPTGADYVLAPGQWVRLFRDGVVTTGVWRIWDRPPQAGEIVGPILDTQLEDALAWTIQLRNVGSTGSRADVKISALADEPSPAAGDFLMVELADGTLARADIGDLPGGGGGDVATDSIWDVLGDLALGSGADTAARLAIGAADTVLVRTAGATAGWEKVTHARMADMSTDHLIGRITASTGVREEFQIPELDERTTPLGDDWLMGSNVAGALLKFDVDLFQIKTDGIWGAKGDLAVGSGIDAAILRTVGVIDGQALRADSVDPTGLSYGKLDYADLQNVSADARLLGRDSPGAGVIEEIAPSDVRSMLNLVVGTDFQKSLSRHFNLADPGASEKVWWFYTDVAITVTAIEALLPTGTATPTVTLNVRHEPSFEGTPNDVCLDNRVVTNVTNGDDLTLGGDITIPAGSHVWVITSAQGGTVPWLALTLRYTED